MIRKSPLFLLFLWSSISLFSQKAYFQQEVNYTIHVELDDQNHFLRGDEVMVYTNNSTKPLSQLFVHLWPNAYKTHMSAFAQQQLENMSTKFWDADREKRGFIDSLNFTVGGEKLFWEYWDDNPDIARIVLSEPLMPGGSISLATPFRVKLPDSFSRLGHLKQQYQIAQWYPKPAVYDAAGWHPIPYLDQGEFYSEYGTFDVFITVPKNYVVGATGDLPENDPEYQWLAEREKVSREMLDKGAENKLKPFAEEFAGNEVKTLHFHQEKVHDFAWFCDKQYYILTDSVALPESGRQVRVVAMFTEAERPYWKESTTFLKKAVYNYSDWIGEYPYNHATAVDGALSAGAGMEYPNITVLGSGGDEASLDQVILHEVGHNWFYGIFGSNERDNPWMDEGINSYFENRYWVQERNDESEQIPKIVGKLAGFDPSHSFVQKVGYMTSAMENLDQPIQYHSAKYSMANYGAIVYLKSARAFRYLEEYLGREMIDKCFHAYFDQWKFKHPQPKDIQKVFEETSGKDLTWFFVDWIQGKHKLDLKIKAAEDGYLVVKNASGIPLPAAVTLYDKNEQPLDTLWTEPFEKEATLATGNLEYAIARVNADGLLPELYDENNEFRKGALCPRCRPLKVSFGYKFPRQDRFGLNILPVIGGNATDGFMFGALLHHGFFPKRNLEFHVMPMFATRTLDIRGSAGITLRWLPNKGLRKIELHSRSSFFSNLIRTRTFLELYLNRGRMRSPVDQKIVVSIYNIGYRVNYENQLREYWAPVFAQAEYKLKRKTVFSTTKLVAEAGGNYAEGVGRASLTASWSHRVRKKIPD